MTGNSGAMGTSSDSGLGEMHHTSAAMGATALLPS